MNRTPSSIMRTVAKILIVAISVYAAGMIIALVADQRAVRLSLWIPSGISLAAALLWGPAAAIGTFLGSFLYRIQTLGGAEHAWIAAGIALGFSAESLLESFLIRRLNGSILPRDIRAVTWILATSFALPLLSVLPTGILLRVGGIEPWRTFGLRFWRMLMGTSLGIVLATPLILLARQALHRHPTGVLPVWVASGFILALFGTISVTVSDSNEKRMLERFRNDVSETARVIQDTIDHDIQVLKSLGAFFEASNEVSSEEFRSFTSRQLGPLSTVITLAWHPRRLSLYGSGEHFPAEFLEPGNTWASAPGFDIASEPKGLYAIGKALQNRQPSALFPVRLPEAVKLDIQAAPGESDFVLAICPVYKNSEFLGVASAWFKPRRWLDKAFDNVTHHDIEFFIFETPVKESSSLISFYPSVTGRQEASQEDASAVLSKLPETSHQFRLSVADADWTVLAIPSPHAKEYSSFSWAWINMLLGLIIVIFFLFYMDGRQKQLVEKERSEAEFRSLTENALTGVLKMKLPGEVLYANESAARMLGAESVADLKGADARTFVVNPESFRRGLEELAKKGQLTNFELEILGKDGQPRVLLCSAALFEGTVNVTFTDISERLKESRKLRQFSRVVEQMADTVVITDTEGSIEYVNPAFEMLTGYSKEEVLAATPKILKSGILGEEFYEALWGTIKRGDVFQADFVNRKKNGDLYTETKTITPLSDAEGKITNYVASGRDVTELRKAEMRLRESNDRFTYLADNIQEVFWMFDMVTWRFLYISPAYEKVWGRSLERMNKDSLLFYEGILPEDRHILEKAIAKSDAGERSEVEYRIETPEGTRRWIWDRSLPVFNAEGKCVTTIGVCTDITDLKQAQHELEALNRDLEARVTAQTEEVRRREEMYRGLFENSNDAIFIISPSGEGIGANQQALDLVGCTMDEYLSVSQWGKMGFADPSKGDREGEKFKAVLRGEQVPLYELALRRNDGGIVETEVNLSLVRDSKGEPVLVQSVMRDITERKKAEESLRESRDRLSEANIALEKASRMKDEFLASMSHELRTPLTGILGLSEAMQLQTFGALNDRQLKALKNIETSGRHLLELINDILDLSKIEAGKLELHFDTCQAADICQASLQLVRGMAQQKRQQYDFTITPANFAVRGDPRRLKQMLVNLLSNAVKFTPEGGKFGLATEADEAAGVARFRVWDKGIGIKPEDQEKIFTPFLQLDSRLARQYSGTGLGLSLVKRMAELHGGTILVESEFGQGSSFTLVLPLVKADGNGGTGTATGGGTAADRAEASVKSAFVIEDNELDSEMLLRMLHSMGIPAISQPLLEGGMDKAIRLKPGAILLDLNLPDGSGWDMLKELKADSRTSAIPVFIVSAESQREKGLSLGAAGYLVKPYSLAQLRAELDKVNAAAGLAAPVLVMEEKARKPVILVTDDNDLILETVTGFMETLGYTVMTAKNGLELVEMAPKVHPDIMLVDVQMPGMDGIEAIRRLRTMGDPVLATVPIISLTALAMVGDREKCIEAGANEYISKPFVLTEVAARVKALLA